jgi:membrane protease YdiL (CAAX protease family)
LFTRAYTELAFYSLLLFTLALHKFFSLPNLATAVLLLPLAFLPREGFGLKSPWNFSLLLLPLLYPIHPHNFLGLSLQAFAEEVFFRAYLMRKLSNLTVSILFVFPHVLLYGGLFSWLTFFPSLLFGFVYQKTHSLALVSLLHLLSNILWFELFSKLL